MPDGEVREELTEEEFDDMVVKVGEVIVDVLERMGVRQKIKGILAEYGFVPDEADSVIDELFDPNNIEEFVSRSTM